MVSNKANGGFARANKLTAYERKQIARGAANARWNKHELDRINAMFDKPENQPADAEETTVTPNADLEIEAIGAVIKALEKHDKKAQKRIIAYVEHFYNNR